MLLLLVLRYAEIPRWRTCYESYSEDPKIVEEMTELIPGLQGDIPEDGQKDYPLWVERFCVISDWQEINRITSPAHSNYTFSVLQGVQDHGPFQPHRVHRYFNLIGQKQLHSHEKNHDAVRRILSVKFIMGLFENPLADYSLVDQFGSQAHRDLAR